MGDFGIKVSEEGVDVKTAKLNQLILHSKYPRLKVFDSGSGTITGISVGTTKTVNIATHNLGYAPMFAVFIQYYDPSTGVKQSYFKPVTISDVVAGGYANLYTADTDNNYLTVTIDVVVADEANLDYQYYIFYDPLPT